MPSVRSPRRQPPAARRGVAGRIASAASALLGALACAAALAVPVPPPGPSPLQHRMDQIEMLSRTNPERAEESLRELLPSLPAGSEILIAGLELEGWLYAHTTDTDAAEHIAKTLDGYANDTTSIGRRASAAAKMVRARILLQTGPMLRVEHLMADALRELPDDTPNDRRLRYLMLQADVEERLGKLDDSVRLSLQALALADATEPPWHRAEIRSSLAVTLYEVGQKERARQMNHEAIQLAEQAGDEVAISTAQTSEAMLFDEGEDDAAELQALRSAIEHARKSGAKRDEVLCLANLADFYLKHGQYNTALQLSQQALPLAREIKSRSSENLAITNMGLALVGLHRKAEAMKLLEQAVAVEEHTGGITSEAETYEEMGSYLEKAGELKDAFDAYRQHRRLADEVFRHEQQQTILEMQEGFDNEQRNRQLELLNRQNRIKKEELLQHDLRQRLWAVGAALGVLSFSVIVLLVQRGRRANRLLASTNELLKVQSERDPLTGLANRRHFQQAMRQLATDGRLSGTVFLLDIDHFKHINDTHGHGAGDAVLVEVARRLRATLREEDLVVRWGGEEFLVVVRTMAPEQVDALAQRLLQAIAGEPVETSAGLVPTSTSIGFATFPLEPAGLALTWERAIELVDTTMYLAKAHGRNRAYGVRLLEASNEAEVERIGKSLEAAWREGKVALTLLQGPVVAGREVPA